MKRGVAICQGDPLDHHGGRLDHQAACIASFPVPWRSPDPGDAVVGQETLLELRSDEATERLGSHERLSVCAARRDKAKLTGVLTLSEMSTRKVEVQATPLYTRPGLDGGEDADVSDGDR